MTNRSTFHRALVGTVLACTTAIATAGPLTGRTLGATGLNDALGPSSSIVGPGAEFNFFNSVFFDFDEDGLLNVHAPTDQYVVNGAGFSPATFSDLLGTIPTIIGFRIVSLGAGTTGITAADLTFTDDSLSIDISATNFSPGQDNLFQLTFAPTAVPEPASVALVGLGLVALGLARRVRRPR